MRTNFLKFNGITVDVNNESSVHNLLAKASSDEVWYGSGHLSPAIRKVYTKTNNPQILDVCLLFAENLPIHIAGRVITAIMRRKVTR